MEDRTAGGGQTTGSEDRTAVRGLGCRLRQRTGQQAGDRTEDRTAGRGQDRGQDSTQGTGQLTQAENRTAGSVRGQSSRLRQG
jgi:hypothetical protein